MSVLKVEFENCGRRGIDRESKLGGVGWMSRGDGSVCVCEECVKD